MMQILLQRLILSTLGTPHGKLRLLAEFFHFL